MSARKTAPSFLQYMLVGLSAYAKGHEGVCRRARFRLASIDQIWSWAANGVLDTIGYKRGDCQGDNEAEQAHV